MKKENEENDRLNDFGRITSRTVKFIREQDKREKRFQLEGKLERSLAHCSSPLRLVSRELLLKNGGFSTIDRTPLRMATVQASQIVTA